MIVILLHKNIGDIAINEMIIKNICDSVTNEIVKYTTGVVIDKIIENTSD